MQVTSGWTHLLHVNIGDDGGGSVNDVEKKGSMVLFRGKTDGGESLGTDTDWANAGGRRGRKGKRVRDE